VVCGEDGVAARLLARVPPGIEFNAHTDDDGATVFRHACAMGLEGIVSKRLAAPYRSGPSRDWIKVKNPDSPAMAGSRLCGGPDRRCRPTSISSFHPGAFWPAATVASMNYTKAGRCEVTWRGLSGPAIFQPLPDRPLIRSTSRRARLRSSITPMT
jgi:hypothetical protein